MRDVLGKLGPGTIVTLALVRLADTLFLSHFMHARRQARFEIGTLEEAKLLTAEEACEMRQTLR